MLNRTALLVALAASCSCTTPRPRMGAERAVSLEAISGVVAAGARWERAWHGTDNADGLVGTADGGVLFAQEQPRRVAKLDRKGAYSVILENTRGVGSLAMTADGRLFGVERACTDPGRRDGNECLEPTAVVQLLPERREITSGKALGRLNDLIVDTDGGAYFTSGGAFYAHPTRGGRPILEGVATNGIMLSGDEHTLYVTNGPVIVAFDVAGPRAVGPPREFARLQAGGNGDGLAIDDAGRLYVTSQPGVQVFAPSGAYLGLIPTPRPVISAAFAGADKRTLYVVGSGAALGPGGTEFTTPEGVRNNAKTIYRIDMLATGFSGRPK